ncbi:FAD-dependent monooxygenase [Pseudonocardia lutea]|uniref:FAD-dependent monooxygenase n=1 Tax=Pseudonocardia lutea TaxID=2172015 RepID=A0ABW1IIQ9_9PSEU
MPLNDNTEEVGMKDNSSTKVLVAGGGIGGLTAAIALRNAGFQVEVFESQPEFTALGVGVIIQPNGLKALRSIGHGIREGLDRVGRPVAKNGPLRLVDPDGRHLGVRSVDELDLEGMYGEPSIIVRRRRLHELLVAGQQEQALYTGKSIVGFEDDGQQVTAKFSDGTTATGDVLIGADGLNSVVRQQLIGKHAPEYTGWGNLRGMATGFEFPEGQEEGLAVVDGEDHIQAVPVGGGDIYFSCAFVAEPGTWPNTAEGAWEEVQRRIQGWYFVEDVLKGCQQDTLVAREIRDHLPRDSWSTGRVTLLGDAAHAMSNFWGQGANSAIEDGIVLARALSAADDVESGLLSYEKSRIPRTKRLQAASRRVDGHVGDYMPFLEFAYGYDAATVPLESPEAVIG